MLKITTSWDDGDVLDKRVADILDTHGLKGTFYIPRDYWGTRLSDNEIKALSTRHEIGAHTLTHTDLSKISLDEAQREIQGSKTWIENIIKEPVKMFCYPRGRYTSEVRNLVKEAGYSGARTTELFSLSVGNPYDMATTVQVYPMPFRFGAGLHKMLGPIRGRFHGFRSLGARITDFRGFEAVAKRSFDTALERGGVFHLWGHSWEIEKYGLWEQFENFCAYIGNRADCEYVFNKELV